METITDRAKNLFDVAAPAAARKSDTRTVLAYLKTLSFGVPFTSVDLQKVTGVSMGAITGLLARLKREGSVRVVGKKRHTYVYELADADIPAGSVRVVGKRKHTYVYELADADIPALPAPEPETDPVAVSANLIRSFVAAEIRALLDGYLREIPTKDLLAELARRHAK